MNHEQATQDSAAERYLLGDLSPDEAGAFEEHYFACRYCADDVRAGAAFLANAKAVVEDRRDAQPIETPARRERPAWWRELTAWRAWIPAAAFACATFYLAGVRIPQIERRYESADSMTSVDSAVLRAETRGDETRLDVPADQRVVVLELDVNPPQPMKSYSVELRGPGDQRVYSSTVKSPPAGESLHLLVPAGRLSSGSYTLIVAADSGKTAAWSSSYRFVLIKQQGTS